MDSESNASGEDNENNYWDTEDELEIENITRPSCSNLVTMNSQVILSNGEASSSANSNLVQQFLGMGFSEKLVSKAIKEKGEDNPDSILEALLTYSALEDSIEEDKSVDINSIQQQECVNKDEFSSEYDDSLLDGFSDSDSWFDSELTENGHFSPKHDNTVILLASMGYTLEDARAAMERCGTDASIAELTDFICAAQMAKTEPVFFEEEKPKNLYGETQKLKRKLHELSKLKRKKQKGPLTEEDDVIRLPNPMIGYGVPSESSIITHRTLPEAAIGPPFFYYENVAFAPKGVWDEISSFLYDIQPEFVDSNYFCAAARKRGYVHNLAINNRFPILPLPPRTITDALPLTKRNGIIEQNLIVCKQVTRVQD